MVILVYLYGLQCTLSHDIHSPLRCTFFLHFFWQIFFRKHLFFAVITLSLTCNSWISYSAFSFDLSNYSTVVFCDSIWSNGRSNAERESNWWWLRIEPYSFKRRIERKQRPAVGLKLESHLLKASLTYFVTMEWQRSFLFILLSEIVSDERSRCDY